MADEQVLTGIIVAERAGRLAVAVCASLLAELGAEVVRLETQHPRAGGAGSPWRDHPLPLAGKTRLEPKPDDPDGAGLWRQMVTGADVVVCDLGGEPANGAAGPVVCTISAAGREGHPDLPADAGEIALQAACGLMATTGQADGPPQAVPVPLLEMFAGINAATAVLAALRVVEHGGPAQRIDMSLFDTSAALLGTFIANVMSGKTQGFRAGCRIGMCAPWNAYPTSDGHVMICSSSDAHWHRLQDLLGAAATRHDPRFADMTGRVRHVDAVDRLVGNWAAQLTTAEALAGLSRSGIPAGPIRSIREILQAAPGPDAPHIVDISLPDGGTKRRCESMLQLSRTPGRSPRTVRAVATGGGMPHHRAPRPTAPRSPPARPLDGVRVIQLGPFTAGPLAGRFLADLGADVIKVEPPGGEASRAWTPRFGSLSGYYVNYHAGKRCIALDLDDAAGGRAFARLLATADVLLVNLKTGALDKLGFGATAVLARYPALIYCSISGYGIAGSREPALDTVIQARCGLMSLAGEIGRPCKTGFSTADLLVAHSAPLAILAALRDRHATGRGQHVDLAMLDAMFWLTQLAWDSPDGALSDFCRLAAADGWVVAEAIRDAVAISDATARSLTCEELLHRLRGAGLRATRIRELGEVFADSHMQARRMLQSVPGPDGVAVTVIGAPFALLATPPRVGAVTAELGRDADWLADDRARAAVAARPAR